MRGDERGSVSAELVLATPLLLVLIMGVVQFALWQHAEHVADAVAQQGLAVGRLQGETAAAGQAEAQASSTSSAPACSWVPTSPPLAPPRPPPS